MRIAVCDDDKSIVNQINQYLKFYFNSTQEKPVITLFYNSESLISELTSNKYDILFLDIAIDKSNGIDAAIKIWKSNPLISIIFVTGYEEYALPAYKAHPFTYILKPISQEKITEVVNHLYNASKIALSDMPCYKYKTSGVLEDIVLESIYYFEQIENRTLIYTTATKPFETYDTLKNAEEQLKMLKSDFYRCHKSFIVNLSKVVECERDHCIISKGSEIKMIPIGSTQRSIFKKIYMIYKREHRGILYV